MKKSQILDQIKESIGKEIGISDGIKMAFNYGLNRVRFINPVPVGSKIRNRAVLKDVIKKSRRKILIVLENTVEIKGQKKPAMVAESLALIII